jgi:hypothetical protein
MREVNIAVCLLIFLRLMKSYWHFILLCPVKRNVNVTIVRESHLFTTMFTLLKKINICLSEMSGKQDLQILMHI